MMIDSRLMYSRRGVDSMKKNWRMAALAALLCLTLTGCLFRSPEELYRPPEKSAGYEQLNQAIRQVRGALEAEYGVAAEDAVIASGDNTATIQLQDLDGDGSRESAVAFLRVPGVEKPLKILVFTQVGEEYALAGLVEGEGSAVYSIEYSQLNGQGRKELVVTWQISAGAYQLGVYTLDELLPAALTLAQNSGQDLAAAPRADLSGAEASELLLTWCSVAADGSNGARLMDMDQDTRTELAVVRLDASGVNSYVELFGWQDGALTALAAAPLSRGVTQLLGIRSDYLSGQPQPPALYITSTLVSGVVAIDVVACLDGEIANLALDDAGISRELLQGYTEVSPTDINGDYVMELPAPNPLPTYGESGSSDFWLIDWCQYDQHGHRNHVLTTYHNVTDGWYLEIPESWRERITISRSDQITGQREVVFSRWRGEDREPEPFLSVYRLSSSRADRVEANGWFLLREEENVIYAARFRGDWDCGLDEQGLRDRFKTIQTSWYYD